MELVVTHRSERIWIAHCGPVFLTVFRDNATVEGLEVMDREEGRLAKANPAGISVIALVPVLPVKAPDPGVREKSGEMFAKHAPSLKASVSVVGGDGFFPSLIRSIIAGAALFSRVRVPTKTVRTVEEAVRFVVSVPDQVPEVARGARQIEAAIGALLAEAEVEL